MATTQELLEYLAKRYTFGPLLDKKIAAALRQPDPLARPPAFLGKEYNGQKLTVPRKVVAASGVQTIRLGHAHGWDVTLFYYPHSGAAYLTVGCRRFPSEAMARDHWRGGMNRRGELRPDASALIDYVAAICKHRGWTW